MASENQNDLLDYLTGLADDQKVSFELAEGRDGRQMATDLALL